MKATAALAVVWLTAISADAGAQAWKPDAVFSQVSTGSATHAWSMGAQWQWRRAWALSESLVVHGRWEFAIGRWRTDLNEEGPDQAWVTQVSAIPTLRLTSLSERGWYAELGSGPSLVMPVFHSRDREFSTELNFQSHLAVGYILGEYGQHDFGVRIEHISNAGIRDPNPGMNFGSLRYTHRFGAGRERLRFASAEEPPGDSTQALHGSPGSLTKL